MNSLVTVPEKEKGLKYEDFKDVKYWAFTGHFHIRQSKGKVFYTGNTFPMCFSDVWDDDRGIMILKWGETPEFEKFPSAPKYRSLNLSELVEDPRKYLDNLTYIKITPDIDITYEDQNLLEDVFRNNFNPRKINFLPPLLQKAEGEEGEFSENEIETIDEIVITGIKSIDSSVIDPEKLIELWLSA